MEEVLAFLTTVNHVVILVSLLFEYMLNVNCNVQITMRGMERPAKIQWTLPFLLPLSSLSDAAARQTFEDIADGVTTKISSMI